MAPGRREAIVLSYRNPKQFRASGRGVDSVGPERERVGVDDPLGVRFSPSRGGSRISLLLSSPGQTAASPTAGQTATRTAERGGSLSGEVPEGRTVGCRTRRPGCLGNRPKGTTAVIVKNGTGPADSFGMYCCGHCRDLHFASDQARRCAEQGQDWVPQAEAEIHRQARRGPLRWACKLMLRASQPWTPSERTLWRALKELLPDNTLLPQWWLPKTDYRVDFLIPEIGLIIEVDGNSHSGRVGCDRLRSADMRALAYDVFRVDSADVMAHADLIAQQVAFRIETELDALPIESEDLTWESSLVGS